jgi:DNA-binding winged helix-turn-helix (wHTH) protein/tetratricopeptide (TPR) repeat protein
MRMQEAEQEATGYRWMFAGAEFDEARWELIVAGQPVELERKPLELLAQLLRHAGEVLTKDELLESVWTGRIVVEAALTNAIGKLRKALGDETQSLIVTVPRVGYRLSCQVSRKASKTLPPASMLSAGDTVPRRANFRLVQRLARNEDSEVWRAEQPKTHETRVFKFSLDGARLSSLKREVTLARLLRDALGEREEFIRVLDWDFDEAPYFIESEFGGTSMDTWFAGHGDRLDRAQRLKLMAETADAVASAHEVGILHKDLKPANVLVYGDPGNWHPRLTDFGSGRVLDVGQLEALGITQLGLTRSQTLSSDSHSGTPLYLAPEVIAGQSPSIKSDLYALGVMLYQLLAGDFRRPLSPGWESDIDDPLLRRDIADFADGDPDKRPPSARELAQRLRTLDARRLRHDLDQAVQARIADSERKLALSRARRPWIAAAMMLSLAGIAGALFYAGLAHQSQLAESAARRQADRNLASAEALNQFLTSDLLGKARPQQGGKSKLTVAEAVDMAEPSIAKRFHNQPLIEGGVRNSMASLYMTLWQLPAAERQGRLAVMLLKQSGATALPQLVDAEGTLARVLSYESKFDEANKLLDARLAKGNTGLSSNSLVKLHLEKCRVAMAQSTYTVALKHCQQAHQLMGRLPTASSSLRATIEQNFGMALLYSNKGVEALVPLRRAVEINSADSGPRHPATLNAKDYLVQALVMNESPEAIKVGEELLKDKTAVYGPDEMSVGTAALTLGSAYFSRGNWHRSVQLSEQAERIFRLSVGTDAPDYLYTLISLGESLRFDKNATRAVATLEDAQKIGSRTRRPDDSTLSLLAYDLAMAHMDIGDTEAARAQLPRIRTKSSEPNVMVTFWPARVLMLDGRIAAAENKPEAALIAFRKALSLFKGDASREPDVLAAQKYVAAHQNGG